MTCSLPVVKSLYVGVFPRVFRSGEMTAHLPVAFLNWSSGVRIISPR
uniref:Uncharacterized protein n=1 Tax=Populus trichocarpa TaxID=3694 RepID=A0A3N7HUG6_POPTR